MTSLAKYWKTIDKEEPILNTRNGRNNKEQSNKATINICKNCGIKGRIAENCWAKGEGKEGQAPEWYKPQEKKDSAKQTTECNDFVFIEKSASIQATDFLSDSGASMHICNDRHQFIMFRMDPSEITGVAPGTTLHVFGIGTVELNLEFNVKIDKTTLRDAKYTQFAK